jgi:hypothetical protein
MGWASRYIEELRAGRPVSFRPHGNSMVPRIKSGQLCTVAPFSEGELPEVDDIVLCTVHGRQFLHLVSATQGDQFQISNNKGHINGWVTARQIYGRLIRVEK